jgi:hypothetical protein
MSEIGLDDLSEDWASVKLPPDETGLPMAVWITENDGYPHDVRVKVSILHGGRGSWRAAQSMAVRPRPREIAPGSLPAADVALVSRWIDLNRDVIIDFWGGAITSREVHARLQRLAP